MDKAIDVWNNLIERFSQNDIFGISDLQDDVTKIQQGDRTISEYFTHLKTLWDELESLQPLPTCVCGALNPIKEIRERDYVIRFLKGRNEQFEHVKTQVMLLEQLPNINKTFSLIVQQEKRLNLGVISNEPIENQAIINLAEQQRPTFQNRGERINGERFNARRGRGNKLCVHCKRANHTVDTCYIKHGFPPRYHSFKGSNVGPHSANIINQESQDAEKSFLDNQNQSSDMKITKEQYQDLMHLLKRSKEGEHSSYMTNMIEASAFNAEIFKRQYWFY
ncbi:uncharacterized protein LOC133291465 [Gastrolobium bilobum]|uniref:uncharacterized protein LOC133291465 n=1 Tax=Gastrolobium bilobum TaxID=150636 RepID=UPI002AB11B00|nr:uncharacterized protein LOC133291465 [Gastrolobium bilobum]